MEQAIKPFTNETHSAMLGRALLQQSLGDRYLAAQLIRSFIEARAIDLAREKRPLAALHDAEPGKEQVFGRIDLGSAIGALDERFKALDAFARTLSPKYVPVFEVEELSEDTPAAE
jgi:hypothetical protein